MNEFRKWMNLLEADNNRSLSVEEIYEQMSSSYNVDINDIIFNNNEIIYKGSFWTHKIITELVNIDFSVEGNLIISETNLKDLMNFPKSVIGDTQVSNNPLLETLKGIQYINSNRLDIYDNPKLKTLEGIEPNSEIKCIHIEYMPNLPMLRLLLAREKVLFVTTTRFFNEESDKKIQDILNKYISDKNMPLYEKQMRCQHELLEYPEYRLNAEW